MAHRKWAEIAAPVYRDPARAARVQDAVDREIEEYTEHLKRLADLRRLREKTQVEVASQLGIAQARVSRIEQRTDLYLSTLQCYVEALGGELELVAVFDGKRFPFSLADLVDPAKEGEASRVTDSDLPQSVSA